MKKRSVLLRVSLVLITLFGCAPSHAMQPSGSWNPWNYLKNISPIITRSLSENRPGLTGALVTGAGLALTTAAIGFLGYSWYNMRNQVARLTGTTAELQAELATAQQEASRAREAAQQQARTREEALVQPAQAEGLGAQDAEWVRLAQEGARKAQENARKAQEERDAARREREEAEKRATKQSAEKQAQIKKLEAEKRQTLAALKTVHDREAREVLDQKVLTDFIAQGYNDGSDKRQLKDIEAAIKRGGVVFYQIINNRINTNGPIDQYLTNIVDLMWYLNEQATMKDQAHDEGAYVLFFKNNPEYTQRFYDFLFNYVQRVNPEWKQQSSHYVAANPYGYARLSSHLTKIRDTQKIQHFGIDVRKDFERWKESMKPLETANAAQQAAQELDRQLEGSGPLPEIPATAEELEQLRVSGALAIPRPGSDGEGWLSQAYQGAASAVSAAAAAVATAANSALETAKDNYRRGVFGTYPYAAHELPSGKEHILFFKYTDPVTDTEKLYIKLENHGIALGDLASHGQEYVAAQQRKTSSGEGDDRPSWRKERVPRKYSDAVANIIKSYKVTAAMPGLIKSFHALNQLLGLAHNDWFTPPLLEALSEYDYLAERTGREVIITKLEALGSYYYELQKTNNLSHAYTYKQLVQSLYNLHNKAQKLKKEYYAKIARDKGEVYFERGMQRFGRAIKEHDEAQNALLKKFSLQLLRTIEKNYQKVETLKKDSPWILQPYASFIDDIMATYKDIAQATRTMAQVKAFFDSGAI